MIGTLTDTFVAALREAPVVTENGVNVSVMNDEGQGLVNTPLPAVVVHVRNSNKPTVFIRGGICDWFDVSLNVLVDFDNYSVTPDGGIQTKMRNMAYEIRRYIEKVKRGPLFSTLIDEYDFFPLYRGIETYQTAAFVGTVGKDIDVFRILYQCTALDKQNLEDEYVMFDSKQINLVRT